MTSFPIVNAQQPIQSRRVKGADVCRDPIEAQAARHVRLCDTCVLQQKSCQPEDIDRLRYLPGDWPHYAVLGERNHNAHERQTSDTSSTL